MRTSALTAMAVLGLTLAGCTSTPDVAESTGPESEQTQTMTVTLTDNIPFDAFHNIDDTNCSAEAFMVRPGTETVDPQVTVTDAEGTIVAVQPVDQTGDEYEDKCKIDVELTVPVSGFYTVTFRDTYGVDHDTTVQDPGDGTGLWTEITF